MAFKWKPGSNPKPVIESILESASFYDGTANIRDIAIHSDIAVLASMLDGAQADDGINSVDTLWDALMSPGAERTPESIISYFNKSKIAQKREGQSVFTVVTTISTATSWLPKSLSLGGMKISFHKGLPSRFLKRRNQTAAEHIKFGNIHDDREDYCFVKIDVSSVNASAAYSLAKRELDLFRGIICLLSNPGIEITVIGSEHKPINVLRTGSFHTVHKPDGSAAADVVWYEPNYRPKRVFEPRDPVRLLRAARQILRLLRAKPYKGRLENAIIRIAEAFDEADPDTAFIKSWSALESILTDKQADYPLLIRRCVFLYRDRVYHEAVLKQLADHRNASVHRVSDGTLSRTFCFLVQGYFSRALIFHLHHQRDFSNFEEALAFLAGPFSSHELEKVILRARRAKRLIGPEA